MKTLLKFALPVLALLPFSELAHSCPDIGVAVKVEGDHFLKAAEASARMKVTGNGIFISGMGGSHLFQFNQEKKTWCHSHRAEALRCPEGNSSVNIQDEDVVVGTIEMDSGKRSLTIHRNVSDRADKGSFKSSADKVVIRNSIDNSRAPKHVLVRNQVSALDADGWVRGTFEASMDDGKDALITREIPKSTEVDLAGGREFVRADGCGNNFVEKARPARVGDSGETGHGEPGGAQKAR